MWGCPCAVVGSHRQRHAGEGVLRNKETWKMIGDRRSAADRRQDDRRSVVDRRMTDRHVDDRRQGDRRRSDRRRQVDPTTCERDYNPEELEFMRAVDDYKRRSNRPFPTWSEVLEVVRALGYRKVATPTRIDIAAQPNAEPNAEPQAAPQASDVPSG